MLTLALLSFGAIYSLIPIIVIVILIAAAAGLSRGMDIFRLMGFATLMQMAGGTGSGTAGKGFSASTMHIKDIAMGTARQGGAIAGGAKTLTSMTKAGVGIARGTNQMQGKQQTKEQLLLGMNALNRINRSSTLLPGDRTFLQDYFVKSTGMSQSAGRSMSDSALRERLNTMTPQQRVKLEAALGAHTFENRVSWKKDVDVGQVGKSALKRGAAVGGLVGGVLLGPPGAVLGAMAGMRGATYKLNVGNGMPRVQAKANLEIEKPVYKSGKDTGKKKTTVYKVGIGNAGIGDDARLDIHKGAAGEPTGFRRAIPDIAARNIPGVTRVKYPWEAGTQERVNNEYNVYRAVMKQESGGIKEYVGRSRVVSAYKEYVKAETAHIDLMNTLSASGATLPPQGPPVKFFTPPIPITKEQVKTMWRRKSNP